MPEYELLCIDPKGESHIRLPDQLLHSLMSNGDLWHEPFLDTETHTISDSSDLSVTVNPITTRTAPDLVSQPSFLVVVSGSFARIEPLRLPIVKHIKRDLSLIYVLVDEVSERIAQEIYPKINRVENRLRRYVIKFFATKIGPDWWGTTVDATMKKNAQDRKNNEIVFSPFVDGNPYRVDFGDIGRIIYSLSTGFGTREEVVQRILSMEETIESLTQLKGDLQSNYVKFFRDTFRDKQFQQKWEELEKIRHKVAHNNLFVLADQDKANALVESLEAIIDEANEGIGTVALSSNEQEAILEVLVDTEINSTIGIESQGVERSFADITADILLENLVDQEARANAVHGYVGLSRFVKVHLGRQGYYFPTSYGVIDRLVDGGLVEKYHIRTPGDYEVLAIRTTVAAARNANEDEDLDEHARLVSAERTP